MAATVVGHEHLVAAMERASLSRLVLASSFAVYDWSATEDVLDEDHSARGALAATTP